MYNKETGDSMAKLIYDFNNLLSDKIGNKNGVAEQDINDISEFLRKAQETVFVNPSAEHQAVFDILEKVDLSAIKKLASEVRQSCENFVVLGIGGSSLGSMAIFEALVDNGYIYMPREKRGGPRFFVEDSIDPEAIGGLLTAIDLKETVFCVVSKSGKTTETMTQFLYFRDLCEQQFGDDWVKHFVVLTDDNQNFLHDYAKENNLPMLIIPTQLGGRYSVLSAVGLFPSAVLGLNIENMISGAKSMLKVGKTQNVWENAPLLSAAINYINYKRGKNITVMIPYSETLNIFDDWFCQLWGESIGRNKTADGRILEGNNRIGQTPIQVTGPSVQHSQFQLYLEGPDDKTFTFVGIKNFKKDIKLPPKICEVFDKEIPQNKTFGDLLNIERVASERALTMFGKPSETIIIEKADEESLGKIFMFFILKMLFTGAMLGITPFGQPAVEYIKREVARLVDASIEQETQHTIVL